MSIQNLINTKLMDECSMSEETINNIYRSYCFSYNTLPSAILNWYLLYPVLNILQFFKDRIRKCVDSHPWRA